MWGGSLVEECRLGAILVARQTCKDACWLLVLRDV